MKSFEELSEELPLFTLTKKGPDYYRCSSKLVGMDDFAMFDAETPYEAMEETLKYLVDNKIIKN